MASTSTQRRDVTHVAWIRKLADQGPMTEP
jgi:hypothetical protein